MRSIVYVHYTISLYTLYLLYPVGILWFSCPYQNILDCFIGLIFPRDFLNAVVFVLNLAAH